MPTFLVILGIIEFVMGIWMCSTGELMGLGVFFIIGGIFLVCIAPLVKKGQANLEAAQAREEARKLAAERKAREQEKYGNAQIIYKRLLNDFNISAISTQKDEEVLFAIVKNFRPHSSLQDAKDIFAYGKRQYEAELLKEKEAELQRLRKPELEKFKMQEDAAQRFGKEKYTYMAQYHKTLDTVNSSLRSAQEYGARNMMNSKAQTQSWATWGGFADALGGPAAGWAMAANIQEHNRQAEQRAAETRCQAAEALDYYHSNPIEKTHTESEEKSMEYIESRLFSDTNADEWFKTLTFKDIQIGITKGKNFIIQGTIQCPASFKLLNRISALDGSVIINIRKKSNNSIVAHGYFAAPGDANMNLNSVGFYPGIIFQSICACSCYNEISDNQNDYTYEIKPYKLWLIEL